MCRGTPGSSAENLLRLAIQPHVVLLLGKKPRPGTIVAETVDLLEDEGARCRVLLPHKGDISPADLADSDLVVHRGLSNRPAMIDLLTNAIGPRCNPMAGVDHLRDRVTLHRALVAAGVPVPAAVVRQNWADVLADARERQVVVKAISGPGRGRGVLAPPLPVEAPLAGPYVVEDLIEHDGIDRKLYVAGEWVQGLLKPSTLVHDHTDRGEPFVVDDALADLARKTVAGLGLHLAGVDVVLGPDGPVVVDANAFPGYRSVQGAAEAICRHLLGYLDRGDSTADPP